jgi:hypothetical protein
MHVLWLILLSWYVATPGPVIISLDIHGCNTAAAAKNAAPLWCLYCFNDLSAQLKWRLRV